MCRLLGIKYFDFDAHKELVENFFTLSEKGKGYMGSSAGHKDGWGIGYYKEGKPCIYKSGASVVKEKDAYFAKLKEASGTENLIVHLRKSAWDGTTNARHAHPFALGNTLLAHNGTIDDYWKAIQVDQNKIKDTEAFLMLMTGYSTEGLEAAFAHAVDDIKKKCLYSALNMLISDGTNIYAYRNFTSQPDYYTLFRTKMDRSTVFCSEQINPNAAWENMDPDKLYTA